MTADTIAGLRIWAREQEALKSLSPLSWQVIARGARHAIHHDRLDVVTAGMTRLIDFLHGGPAPSFGTTRVE
jgi:hypothetical protein